MEKKVVIENVYRGGNHYLIHVFFKDLSSKDLHAYNSKQFEKLVNELYNNPKVHDFYVYVGIDFDLREVE